MSISMQHEINFASQSAHSNASNVETPETTVTINARSRHGLLRKIKSVQIDLNLLSSMFHMRQDNAARSLGVSLTSLKIACRRLGLSRWPYNGGVRAEGSGSGRGEGSTGEGGAGRREEEAVEDEEEGGEEEASEGEISEGSNESEASLQKPEMKVETCEEYADLGPAPSKLDSSPVAKLSDTRADVVVGQVAEEMVTEDFKYDFGDVSISDMRWLGCFLRSDDSSPI
ncbi:hypothetical protein GUITHDRAFT_104292 [Guillardia theta CCMP2712]|uniref:RWP-RK domain-containing protein n=1 Tax=Guillardia theta (strain CCMP2712) TaxID=905079 RepID=L1JNP4_GUITC|nr:hypothetical protein GUITHDRAFT_104292 [Guillardia theta CCMP2712]EKX49894.1 hypothetical protein GUITHDRAFT_104292 [Guillardia theta CCMP2712]|eukprot:XP_005836874.1 hypothetical protein GUITHDRAFT_104292 [Guillardia theta CCMP2712]